MDIKITGGVPDTEVSREFLQGMADRMANSYAKYGPVAQAYPHRVDAIASLKLRLEKYALDGNTEWLMDVANFAMIEFMRPRHPKARYTPQDGVGRKKASLGRVWDGEVNPSQRANDPAKWVER